MYSSLFTTNLAILSVSVHVHVGIHAWLCESVTYGDVVIHLLVCFCVNECVCLWVLVCEWVEAPGQAIRYWCSRLGVRRGKWMCVRVCPYMRVWVCAGGSCGVVKQRLVKDGQHWYDQSSVDQDVLLPPRCSFSLNFTVNSLFHFSLSFWSFFSLCLRSLCHFEFRSWCILFSFSSSFFFLVDITVVKVSTFSKLLHMAFFSHPPTVYLLSVYLIFSVTIQALIRV